MQFIIPIALFAIFMISFMFYTEIKHERRFPWFSTIVFALLLVFAGSIAFH